MLTNRALEAGIAGRGLRQALAEFAQHADDNASAFRRMGVEIMDNDGNMKQLTEIAQEFQSVMGEGVNDMDVMIALMEDLNVRGATAFVHLVQNADEFTAAVGNLENAAGSAHEMAMVQQESLENQIQVVKNALLAPFILSDKIGQEAGFLNVFAKEVHGIVDVVEGLFIKTMDDGSVALTKMGEIMRDFVIGALHTAKDILIIVVDIMKQFAEEGHSMTGLLQLFVAPLKLVVKLLNFFGEGTMEAVVQYKLMNALLPINSTLLARNISMMMNHNSIKASTVMLQNKEFTVQGLLNQRKQVELLLEKAQSDRHIQRYTERLQNIDAALVASGANDHLAGSFGRLMLAELAAQGALMGMALLTQKFANDAPGMAMAIGAIAGAVVGLSIALKLVEGANPILNAASLGAYYWKAIAAGAAAGMMYNLAMQQMMKPPDMSSYTKSTANFSTMDTGGRFMQRRMYDMGGYTQDHGVAVLQKGETVIPKTQNMLGGGSGSGITLNIHGDVYDSDNFAEKISEVLPTALRKNNDIGGI